MFTVVEWHHDTPTASRDLMVTETNLETGRLREHQVEFFFFKLVGDWNMAQRMGNYWRQHYGLDTYPVDTTPAPPTPSTMPTDALDTPYAVAVQLIREMRNLPLAGSIDEYNAQLLALVEGSGRDSTKALEVAAKAASEAGEKLAFMTPEHLAEAAEAASNEASRVLASGPKPVPGGVSFLVHWFKLWCLLHSKVFVKIWHALKKCTLWIISHWKHLFLHRGEDWASA
eukprot:s919_g2.t1